MMHILSPQQTLGEFLLGGYGGTCCFCVGVVLLWLCTGRVDSWKTTPGCHFVEVLVSRTCRVVIL